MFELETHTNLLILNSIERWVHVAGFNRLSKANPVPRCQPGGIFFCNLWDIVHLLDHFCWQNLFHAIWRKGKFLCSCRPEIPISLMAGRGPFSSSRGHTHGLLPSPTKSWSQQRCVWSSHALNLWPSPSLTPRFRFKGLVISTVSPGWFPYLRSTDLLL